MSRENIELYRRGIDAFNRRDLEAFLALADPDVVGVSRVLAIEGGSYRGAHGDRSTAPLEEIVWQVSEWRDGRVVRWQMYETEQDALEAAGIAQ